MVVDTRFYDTLGICPDATQTDIKKAFHKFALHNHPDKVSESEKEDASIRFREAQNAYDILRDPITREIYDTYGLEGVQNCNNVVMDDLYAQMFDGMDINGSRRESVNEKSFKNIKKDVFYEYNVTLEELYHGKHVKMAGKRNIICPMCKGSGIKLYSNIKKCAFCNGKGLTIILKQIKPGMIVQQELECQKCNATGEIVQKKDKCRKCKGIKTIMEKNIYEININKGTHDGEKVIFYGEADEEPGAVTGDLIFIIKQKKHDRFERSGSNLKCNLNITLSEALCGFSRVVVETLDGRGLYMTHPFGKVLYPGQILVVHGEGMPSRLKDDENGDLYLEVVVQFPPDGFLHEAQLKKLMALLPSNPIQNSDLKIINDVKYDIGNIEDYKINEPCYNESGIHDNDEKQVHASQCNQQ